MTLAASGSSLGGILLPIMVNHFFHDSVGFANGVRAVAGLISGLQILALCMIRTKYPLRASGSGAAASLVEAGKAFSADFAYCWILLG